MAKLTKPQQNILDALQRGAQLRYYEWGLSASVEIEENKTVKTLQTRTVDALRAAGRITLTLDGHTFYAGECSLPLGIQPYIARLT